MRRSCIIVFLLSLVIGAHAQHDAIEDEIELFYDNGEYATMMGAGCYINWAVMFPTEMLQETGVFFLNRIALYEYSQNTHDLKLKIRLGGDTVPGETVCSEVFTPSGEDGFQYHELESPIFIDGTQNLWIVFEQIQGWGLSDTYPASTSNDVSGNPNGRWITCDNYNWYDLAEAGMPGYTWMIRAYGINLVGVEESLAYEALSLYPNPTTGQFTVEGANVAKVEVYNLVGQKVHETEGQVVNVDAANWHKGIYFVNIIEQNGASVTKKLVVK